MTKQNFVRLLSLFSTALICLTVVSCTKQKKEINEEPDKTPYEESIPASFSMTAGVGRTVEDDTLEQQAPTGHRIVIDPGHGFWDGGCGEGVYTDGTLEKDINFAVAEKLNERLKLLGYETLMTHDGENLPAANTNGNNIFSATERVAYVNSLDGYDYLISIHVNSFDDEDISGMSIYYQQSKAKINDWGQQITTYISEAIGEEVEKATAPKIKDGTDPNTSFALTRDVQIASSLIEIGFVTNPDDAENMIDPEWQNAVANAIADGIDRFFKEKDGTGNN